MKVYKSTTPEGDYASLTIEENCSVELSRTAKGDISFTIKAYAHSTEEAWGSVLKTYELIEEWRKNKVNENAADKPND